MNAKTCGWSLQPHRSDSSSVAELAARLSSKSNLWGIRLGVRHVVHVHVKHMYFYAFSSRTYECTCASERAEFFNSSYGGEKIWSSSPVTEW